MATFLQCITLMPSSGNLSVDVHIYFFYFKISVLKTYSLTVKLIKSRISNSSARPILPFDMASNSGNRVHINLAMWVCIIKLNRCYCRRTFNETC